MRTPPCYRTTKTLSNLIASGRSTPTPTPSLPSSPPTPGGVPEALKGALRWVVWKLAWTEKKNSWDKVPVNPRTGRNARANQPRTWGSFALAVTALAVNPEYAGLGYQFEADAGEFGIDLDGCRDPDTGEITNWRKRSSTCSAPTPRCRRRAPG